MKKVKIPKEKKTKDTKPKTRRSGTQWLNAVSDYFDQLRLRFRLSLSLRISLNYAWLLLRSLFGHLFFFSLLFLGLCAIPYVQNTLKTYDQLPAIVAGDQTFYQQEDIWTCVYDSAGKWIAGTPENLLPIRSTGLVYLENSNQLFVSLPISATDSEVLNPYTIFQVYDVTKPVMFWLAVLGILTILELLRAITLVQRSRISSKRLLQPLNQIAEIAQTLSVNNLSARINISGTQNELKDLAIVINDMLSRIEVSYNSQRQFVSDASHELRTPIAVIQGYARMLNRWGKDDPEIRDESIEAILSESVGMQGLVESLLFLARHDKLTLKMELSTFDASELLNELFRDTQLIIQERTILLEESESCLLLGDRNALKQALRIFIDNAIKYTQPGGQIHLSGKKVENSYHFTVRDNGIGMTGEDLSKAFERFYRADSARSNQIQGHGLGLSIARIIALGHRGKIEVLSKPGVGSSFILILPL